jgi:hypothetical protein
VLVPSCRVTACGTKSLLAQAWIMGSHEELTVHASTSEADGGE